MLKIKDLMHRGVVTCTAQSTLSEAAQLMWEHDVGFVPVVEPASGKLAGVITDRDICMAALTRGTPLHLLDTRTSMATKVIACRENDAAQSALDLMRSNQVHRLPVMDNNDKLTGVISLADMARAARANAAFKVDMAGAITDISSPRTPVTPRNEMVSRKRGDVAPHA